jgi:hypothetical protein
MQSSPLPCYLIPLRPKYPPQHSILEEEGSNCCEFEVDCAVCRESFLESEGIHEKLQPGSGSLDRGLNPEHSECEARMLPTLMPLNYIVLTLNDATSYSYKRVWNFRTLSNAELANVQYLHTGAVALDITLQSRLRSGAFFSHQTIHLS